MNLSLGAQIESLLFWKGEPLSVKKIAQLLSKNEEEISNALPELAGSLKDRGISLQEANGEVALATHPEMSAVITELTKEELSRDLGKAGLETLSLILYRGPIKRSEIDYVRGVQSQFILRNLLVRGLIERVSDPKDERSFFYKPTFDLLSYLGINKVEDLPEYEQVKNEVESHKEEKKIDSA